jgi:hypothetical protein
MQRKWSIALMMVIGALLIFVPAISAESVNVLKNGSFEEEFSSTGVGKYWTAFSNGGRANYAYHDDSWGKTVYDGRFSQLIEISTLGIGASDKDRYAGIYQVANVVAGQRYMFSFYGMARSTEGTEQDSKWNYRIQIGFDYGGGTDPWAVSEWAEMPWVEYPRLAPGRYLAYARGVTTTSDQITVFIRGWKKFPTIGQNGNLNIDAVSLVGPNPKVAQNSMTPSSPTIPQTGAGTLLPLAGIALVGLALTLTSRRVFGRRP